MNKPTLSHNNNILFIKFIFKMTIDNEVTYVPH